MKNTLTILSNKKVYTKPTVRRLGKVSSLTLKGGSTTDFGANKYDP